MSYSRVDSILWDDEKFIALPDAERNLFLLLLTGPQRTSLPGLQRVGIAALAETLRRPVDAVFAALRRLVADGMVEFDDVRRVVRIPRAPKWNPAETPNQLHA